MNAEEKEDQGKGGSTRWRRTAKREDWRLASIPTYVYPADLFTLVRQSFPEVNAGLRDAEFSASGVNVHNVTWDELAWANQPSGLIHPRLAGCAKNL